VISGRVTPLKYFMRSGRGGGPYAGKNRNILVSFLFLSSQWKAGAEGSGRGTPFIMAPTRPTNTQQRESECANSTVKFVHVRMPVPRFVTFKLEDTDKTMRRINPFYKQKALDAIAGKFRTASRFRKRTLLIEKQNDKQAQLLLKSNLLGSCPIQVERHALFNSSRGVVNTDSLDGMSDDEIQTALANQPLSRTYRLVRKRDEKLFPLKTIFFTFEVPSLPSYYIYISSTKGSLYGTRPEPNVVFPMPKVWAHTTAVCF
jgi:hypothetical protein